MKKTKITKQYSLNDRINHYSNIMKEESKKFDKTKKASNKLLFAMGYEQGATRGLSLDHNRLSKYEKLGQIAGDNARKKSENIKF